MLDKNYKGELDSVKCEFRHDLVFKTSHNCYWQKGGAGLSPQ